MENVRYVMRVPEVCFTQTSDEEMITLNPEDGRFYHLNASAVDLWHCLETPQSLEALVWCLFQKYEGADMRDYWDDVETWVNAMCARGLLSSHIKSETVLSEPEALKSLV